MTFTLAVSIFSLVFVLWIGAYTRRLDRETMQRWDEIERERLERDRKSSTPTGSDDPHR